MTSMTMLTVCFAIINSHIIDYRSMKSRVWSLKPAGREDIKSTIFLYWAEVRIHFKAQIQTFSIGTNNSSQYYQTISTEEDCDLNGNHPTQWVTNIFHANRHDFALPPRTYESQRHIALSRSANMRDILTRTKLHLPQCGDMYDLFDVRCTFEASLPARGRSHRSDVPMPSSSCFSILNYRDEQSDARIPCSKVISFLFYRLAGHIFCKIMTDDIEKNLDKIFVIVLLIFDI